MLPIANVVVEVDIQDPAERSSLATHICMQRYGGLGHSLPPVVIRIEIEIEHVGRSAVLFRGNDKSRSVAKTIAVGDTVVRREPGRGAIQWVQNGTIRSGQIDIRRERVEGVERDRSISPDSGIILFGLDVGQMRRDIGRKPLLATIEVRQGRVSDGIVRERVTLAQLPVSLLRRRCSYEAAEREKGEHWAS